MEPQIPEEQNVIEMPATKHRGGCQRAGRAQVARANQLIHGFNLGPAGSLRDRVVRRVRLPSVRCAGEQLVGVLKCYAGIKRRRGWISAFRKQSHPLPHGHRKGARHRRQPRLRGVEKSCGFLLHGGKRNGRSHCHEQGSDGPSQDRKPREQRSGAGRYGASGSGLKKPQAGTPVLRGGAFPGVQAPCETVGKGRYFIFETTSGVVLDRARILRWHPATLRFAPSLRPSHPPRLAPFRQGPADRAKLPAARAPSPCGGPRPLAHTPNCRKWWSRCLYIRLAHCSGVIFPKKLWGLVVHRAAPPAANLAINPESRSRSAPKSRSSAITRLFAVGEFFFIG